MPCAVVRLYHKPSRLKCKSLDWNKRLPNFPKHSDYLHQFGVHSAGKLWPCWGHLWLNSACPAAGGPNYFGLGCCLDLMSQITGRRDCPQIVPKMKNWQIKVLKLVGFCWTVGRIRPFLHHILFLLWKKNEKNMTRPGFKPTINQSIANNSLNLRH